MEEENLDIEYATPTKTRPTFISVLCILSWIYVGIAVLSSLNNAFTSQEDMEAQMELSRAQIEDGPLASNPMMQDIVAFSEGSLENTKSMNLWTLVLILIEGIAVYMMFKLNKMGFWLYLLSNVAIVGVTSMYMPWPNIMSTFVVGFTAFFGLLFVILYGVNLKHMK